MIVIVIVMGRVIVKNDSNSNTACLGAGTAFMLSRSRLWLYEFRPLVAIASLLGHTKVVTVDTKNPA